MVARATRRVFSFFYMQDIDEFLAKNTHTPTVSGLIPLEVYFPKEALELFLVKEIANLRSNGHTLSPTQLEFGLAQRADLLEWVRTHRTPHVFLAMYPAAEEVDGSPLPDLDDFESLDDLPY